ncbi:hypothetical protein BH20CHL6_BH20CHL6_17400 [soil metagenome]
MSSRHNARRRRAYGRRQHELHERNATTQQSAVWDAIGGESTGGSRDMPRDLQRGSGWANGRS